MRIENVYLPTGRGTLEEQVEEIREYLQIITRRYTTMADTSYNILEELYRALTEEREDYNNAAIKKLWDKIEENNAKNLNYSMSNTFLRKTDFGSYFENATVTINGTPIGITQLYEYTAGIGTIGDLTDAEVSSHSSILTGLLYYDEDPITHQPTIPRYGVAVGEVTTMTDGQGRKIVDLSNLLGTFTSNELAFWNNGTKVMSLNANDGLTTEGIIKASGGNIGDLNIAVDQGTTGLVWESTTPNINTIITKDRTYYGNGVLSHLGFGRDTNGVYFDVTCGSKASLSIDNTLGGILLGDWDMTTMALHYGQVDGTSTSTVFTATVPGITSLRDGVCVVLKNGIVTSASGFTINVNGLGAKPVYSNLAEATADTTIFNVNYTMMFIYDSTRVTGGCWICYRGYDSNTNTIGYQVRTNSMTLPTTDKFYRYRLLFRSPDGTHFIPANTSTSTNATAARTPNTRPIDPFGGIRYYGSTTIINAEGTPGVGVLWQQYNITLGYSFNTTGSALTLTTNVPVYIKCSPLTSGMVTIDSTEPITQVLPLMEDGFVYIYLGVATSATTVEVTLEHPIYWYKNGYIRQWTNAV